MVLVKHRQYQEVLYDPLPGLPLTTDTSFLLSFRSAPTTTHRATLLRTRSEWQVDVRVGSAPLDIPSAGWWAHTSIVVAAWFSETAPFTLPPLSGTSEGFLGSTMLVPTLVAVPVEPASYTVRWVTQRPLITETSRKGSGGTQNPRRLLGMYVHDPELVFSNPYGGISVDASGMTFDLWGDTV